MPVVNGEIVDPGLIEEAFSRLKAEAEMLSQVSCCERDSEFLVSAENEVIDGILLSQEAERRVPAPSPAELQQIFEATLRTWRAHGASWEMLEARTRELREEAISSMKMERFTEDLWKSLPEIPDSDIRAWYDANLVRFRTPPAARVIHLVRFPGTGDPWDEYAAMLEWRKQALAGEDFEALAKAHTAKRDGQIDLGWVEQERLLNPFEAMLFSLQQDEISPVFLYEQALHLVKVIEIRPATVQPFEEVAAAIRQELELNQRRDALQQLATTLRQSAVIEREHQEA
jgi:hypothetical protein